MSSEERIDTFARINWRYLCGPGAAKQPRGTFSPVTEPFVDDDPVYFDTPLGDWVDQAACAEADPRLFDCDARENGDTFGVERGREAATRFCAHCLVVTDCLNEGARMAGLWGGDARDRRAPRDRPRVALSSLLPEPEPPADEPAPMPPAKPRKKWKPVSLNTQLRNAEIKRWAEANGWAVPHRQAPPRIVRDAYKAAHPTEEPTVEIDGWTSCPICGQPTHVTKPGLLVQHPALGLDGRLDRTRDCGASGKPADGIWDIGDAS